MKKVLLFCIIGILFVILAVFAVCQNKKFVTITRLTPSEYEEMCTLVYSSTTMEKEIYLDKGYEKIFSITPNTKIYKLEPDFVSYNFYYDKEQIVFVDKTNTDFTIKAFWFDMYSKSFVEKPLILPKYLKNYKLNNVFQVDPFKLLLVFSKGKKVQVLSISSGDEDVRKVAEFKTKCLNSGFVYIPDKNSLKKITLLAVGGVLLNANFICQPVISQNDENACNSLEKIQFNY